MFLNCFFLTQWVFYQQDLCDSKKFKKYHIFSSNPLENSRLDRRNFLTVQKCSSLDPSFFWGRSFASLNSVPPPFYDPLPVGVLGVVYGLCCFPCLYGGEAAAEFFLLTRMEKVFFPSQKPDKCFLYFFLHRLGDIGRWQTGGGRIPCEFYHIAYLM